MENDKRIWGSFRSHIGKLSVNFSLNIARSFGYDQSNASSAINPLYRHI